MKRQDMIYAKDNRIRGLQLKAEYVRKQVVELIYASKCGHIGGGLSSVEIEIALYFEIMNIDPKNPLKEDRDRFILSKGHSVESLYAVLVSAGFFDKEILDTYSHFNSMLAGHPTRKVPGVELNSGALGHGLSVGVGMAIAAKMDQKKYRMFILMGDGEQGEGSIYEAAMSASHYKLDNLVAIIDRNTLQISGKTEEIMSLEPLKERWESFGWEVVEVDGNNIEDVVNAFKTLNYINSRPKLVIAHTTKGCGISFMEKIAKWHHGIPNKEQFEEAIAEINDRINNLNDLRYE